MKRIAMLCAAVVVFTAGAASAQSLGNYAREIRKQKSPAPQTQHYFDNDNLPTNDALSVIGPSPAEETDAGKDADAAPSNKPADAPKSDAKAPGASKPSDFKQKIDDQKAQIDILSRELDVLQGEYRLRAAAMYADAGNRLRNQFVWDKEDAEYKQKIADKQKALDDAKNTLSELQEQARKAGSTGSTGANGTAETPDHASEP
jgi:hypothetical protein